MVSSGGTLMKKENLMFQIFFRLFDGLLPFHYVIFNNGLRTAGFV